MKISLRTITKKVIKDIFLKLVFNILNLKLNWTEQKLNEFHNDLPFLPEKMKIEKIERLVANLHGKAEYFMQIRTLK